MAEEYISRKSVRDAIASLSIERFELTPAYRLYVEALDNVDKKVVKIPAAYVLPVRQGQWKGQMNVSGYDVDYCSECGWTKDVEDRRYYRFCPNCGAFMDKGVSDV